MSAGHTPPQRPPMQDMLAWKEQMLKSINDSIKTAEGQLNIGRVPRDRIVNQLKIAKLEVELL